MPQIASAPSSKRNSGGVASACYIFDSSFISLSDKIHTERLRATRKYLRKKSVPIPSERGKSNYAISVDDLLDMCVIAERLAVRYDVGIGLAFGGVGPAFMFERYGLDVRLVHAKRKGRGATWRSIDSLTKDSFRGKNVLVIDEDAVTGKTLRRTLREIVPLGPKNIDLFLMHKAVPRYVNGNLQSYPYDVRESVPEGFNKIMTLPELSDELGIMDMTAKNAVNRLQHFGALLRR